MTIKRGKKFKLYARTPEIKEEKCRFVEEDELPMLVLSLKKAYRFKKGLNWEYLVHQTAGHACNSHYIKAIQLNPKPKAKRIIQEINDEWLESDCGLGVSSLNEILKYREKINKELKVDCNTSYMDFEEGIYPIDCTSKNLKKLCRDKLPDRLDDLLYYPPLAGIIGRWKLYILGQNCD
jgi:hypothetical protein